MSWFSLPDTFELTLTTVASSCLRRYTLSVSRISSARCDRIILRSYCFTTLHFRAVYFSDLMYLWRAWVELVYVCMCILSDLGPISSQYNLPRVSAVLGYAHWMLPLHCFVTASFMAACRRWHPSSSAASSDYWWWSGVKEGTLTQLL